MSENRTGRRPIRAEKTQYRRDGSANQPKYTSPRTAVARPNPRDFLIVGLGASAGGLEALEEFFNQMPPDTGMAFVVVTHRQPGHTSLLPNLLRKRTLMPLTEAEDGTRVEPNRIYLSRAEGYLAILDGRLHTMNFKEPAGGVRLPIDYFFRALAQDQHERAVGIVLSGTGTDGSLGLKAIKGAGGMAIAQETGSARYPGMPGSYIGTGLVDCVLRGEQLENRETVAIAKNGRAIDVACTASPIRDSKGNILGISAILRDISRQKWAETALRKSEEALVDFFNAAPLGLLWVAADGRIRRANQALLALLGCAGKELLGRPVATVCADPEVAEDLLERLRCKENLTDVLVKLRARDGSSPHVLMDANGLWEADQLVNSRWFLRDVSRRIELEREILLTGERVQRRIGQDLHDDVCQQLTSIEYLVRSLERRLAAKFPAEAHSFREIGRLVRTASTRTRDLAHGVAPMELESLGLVEALKNLAAQTKNLAGVDCRFRASGPVAVDDPVAKIYFYRIAQEAINNAMRRGKARRIDIVLEEKGKRLLLSVEDNGVGLPKRFRRNKGLGLRIMDYRAGVLGGTFAIRRRPKRGTTVSCSIPLDSVRREKGE